MGLLNQHLVFSPVLWRHNFKLSTILIANFTLLKMKRKNTKTTSKNTNDFI